LRRKNRGEIDPDLAERLEELAERFDEELAQLRGDMVELSERQEFTERVLIEVRQREGLPEPKV
jgi:hypothetical protein